jgi:DNA topoisomerase-1
LNKRISFAPASEIRQANTSGKFTKTSDILKNWKKIQTHIEKGVLSKDPVTKQSAIISNLIQLTGIRIGNERDEDSQALTYGASTLLCGHISFPSNDEVTLDFLGKDSVRYLNTVKVGTTMRAELFALKGNRGKDEKLFDKADSGTVKAFLGIAHKGLTPKQIRTVVCNETLINNLKAKNITKDNTEAEKLRAIFEANLEIARTLNHQKNVSKNQKEGEEKIADRVKNAKERIKTLKIKHAEKLAKLDEQAAKAKIAFKGTKLLKEKLAKIEETKANLITQMGKAKVAAEKAAFNLDKKKLTKDIALGTSLSAYADPQLLYSYLKTIELPISRIYTPQQMKNCEFAEGVDPNYWRTYPS